jgi:hypothetical protein
MVRLVCDPGEWRDVGLPMECRQTLSAVWGNNPVPRRNIVAAMWVGKSH